MVPGAVFTSLKFLWKYSGVFIPVKPFELSIMWCSSLLGPFVCFKNIYNICSSCSCSSLFGNKNDVSNFNKFLNKKIMTVSKRDILKVTRLHLPSDNAVGIWESLSRWSDWVVFCANWATSESSVWFCDKENN